MEVPNHRSSAWLDWPDPAYLIALVLIALLLGIGAATVGRQQASMAAKANCVSLDENALRLVCYDKVFHRVPDQPVKGANAPPLP